MPTLPTLRHALALALAPALLALAAMSASAQQTTYADRATFLAALAPNATTIDFSGSNVSSGPIDGAGALTFTTSAGTPPTLINYAHFLYGLSTYPNLMVNAIGSSGYVLDVGFGGSIPGGSIPGGSIPGGSVTAFGVAFGRSLDVDPSTVFTFTLLDGTTSIYSATRTQSSSFPGFDFFGVTSTTPFTSIALAASNGPALYDDMTYGAVMPPTPTVTTPEPATLALVAPVVLLGALGRRVARFW